MTDLRARITELAAELEQPVVRAAIYAGEHQQGRHEGEDAERLAVAARLRVILEEGR